MRIRCARTPALAQIVAAVQCATDELEVSWSAHGADLSVEIGGDLVDLRDAPSSGAEDDLDRVAMRAGYLAERLGIATSSPLLRSLRDDERRIRPGRATSLACAEEWLRLVVVGAPDDPFTASLIQRLAPAMLPLSAMSSHYLATKRTKAHKAIPRFLDFVERRCADQRYAVVQEKFLNYRALYQLSHARGRRRPEFVYPEKYLYLPIWANTKLVTATKLQLDETPPISVLDLGSGPAHFALVCEHFGHDCWGIDIPLTPNTPFSRHDMYGELFDCFGVRRSMQRIVAHQPIEVPRRFGLVTSLMANFCSQRTPIGSVAWQWAEWRFFLRDLIQSVVTPRFRIHLHVNQEYLALDVVDRLRALGATIDLERLTILITEAQAAAILESPV